MARGYRSNNQYLIRTNISNINTTMSLSILVCSKSDADSKEKKDKSNN